MGERDIISRREFMRIAAVGAAGAVLPFGNSPEQVRQERIDPYILPETKLPPNSDFGPILEEYMVGSETKIVLKMTIDRSEGNTFSRLRIPISKNLLPDGVDEADLIYEVELNPDTSDYLFSKSFRFADASEDIYSDARLSGMPEVESWLYGQMILALESDASDGEMNLEIILSKDKSGEIYTSYPMAVFAGKVWLDSEHYFDSNAIPSANPVTAVRADARLRSELDELIGEESINWPEEERDPLIFVQTRRDGRIVAWTSEEVAYHFLDNPIDVGGANLRREPNTSSETLHLSEEQRRELIAISPQRVYEDFKDGERRYFLRRHNKDGQLVDIDLGTLKDMTVTGSQDFFELQDPEVSNRRWILAYSTEQDVPMWVARDVLTIDPSNFVKPTPVVLEAQRVEVKRSENSSLIDRLDVVEGSTENFYDPESNIRVLVDPYSFERSGIPDLEPHVAPRAEHPHTLTEIRDEALWLMYIRNNDSIISLKEFKRMVSEGEIDHIRLHPLGLELNHDGIVDVNKNLVVEGVEIPVNARITVLISAKDSQADEIENHLYLQGGYGNLTFSSGYFVDPNNPGEVLFMITASPGLFRYNSPDHPINSTEVNNFFAQSMYPAMTSYWARMVHFDSPSNVNEVPDLNLSNPQLNSLYRKFIPPGAKFEQQLMDVTPAP